jgi:three-Cys-motif partner protein
LCYIDAFAGSGSIKIKGGDEIEGSAIRALKYPFDKFLFFEEDNAILEVLEHKISLISKDKDIELHNADCNNFLLGIDKINWISERWRGIIFLDPYAMDLDWICLDKIRSTKVFDVWYLFPFMAVNRNMYKKGKIPEANKAKLNRILGTTDWESVVYYDSPQLNFLEENIKLKTSVNNIKNFIIERLKLTFPTVSEKAVLLRNTRRSPQFLLCFAGSNPNPQAQALSLRAADFILSRI